MSERNRKYRGAAQDAGIVSAVAGQLREDRSHDPISGRAHELVSAAAWARDALARDDAREAIRILKPLQPLIESTTQPSANDAIAAATASVLLAQAYTALEDAHEAKRALTHAVDLYEPAREAMTATDWSDYGTALLMLGRYEESVRALETAVEGGMSVSGETHRALGAALALRIHAAV